MKKTELLKLIREEVKFVKKHLTEDARDMDQRIRDYLHDRYDDEPKVIALLKQKGFVGGEIRDSKTDISWLLAFAKRFNDKILQHLIKGFIPQN